jgi:pyruvate,orthophosphate dikinase
MVPLDGSQLPSREDIGGKAWSIAWMRRLGLPVPPAFVLSTAACRDYYARGEDLSEEVWDFAGRGIAELERATGRTFGSGPRPLLLSVRSGAAVSMPGMMDTVLNLGINDEIEAALAAETKRPAYAQETHRRFLEAYGRIVMRAEVSGAEGDGPEKLRRRIEEDCGHPVPGDVWRQLREAIGAVFRSWMTPRARAYRRHYAIPDEGGTAVTIQAMVFGNLDENSGTGVLFTRNPLSGAPEPFGEYLPLGQGEDVVSGQLDPLPLHHLQVMMPAIHQELVDAGRALEHENRDAQDIEFTVESRHLYLLQARVAKRSPRAAVRIAVDLVREGRLTPDEALVRVTPAQVRSLLRPRIEDSARRTVDPVFRGEPACPGVAQGVAVADPDEASRRAESGEAVVLVLPMTSPEDVHGMIAADGVCTEKGGSTSHAAVVSRALGRPCVVACGERTVTGLAGHPITLDGETGAVYSGLLPLERVGVEKDEYLSRLAGWASQRAPLRVFGLDVPMDGDTVDLDEMGLVDPDRLADVLTAGSSARGRVLGTEAGVRAAVEAGLAAIAVEEPLPALLASLGVSGTGGN